MQPCGGRHLRGEVAHRIIHDIEGVREISLVENPADKRARAMYYDGMDLLLESDGRLDACREQEQEATRAPYTLTAFANILR